MYKYFCLEFSRFIDIIVNIMLLMLIIIFSIIIFIVTVTTYIT